MKLSDYQEKCLRTDTHRKANGIKPSPLLSLLGLSGETGQLLAEYKKLLRDGPSHERFKDRVFEEIGDILWYSSSLASQYDLSLEDIASANLEKTQAMFAHNTSVERLDEAYDPTESFPDHFTLTFSQEMEGGRMVARTKLNGLSLGDKLTDNALLPDGYRFHDIFHAGFAAVLHWSPVLRALMKRKRKSDPMTDEVEDGGRAVVIEEGISAAIFGYAKDHRFLEGIVELDEELMSSIRWMVGNLEVSKQPESLWRSAILQGYEAWRATIEHGGGEIHADLRRRKLSWSALPP